MRFLKKQNNSYRIFSARKFSFQGKLDLKVLLLNLKIWFKNFVIKIRIEVKSLSLKTMFLN